MKDESQSVDNSIGIANAPCSWGVLEFEQFGNPPVYTQVLEEMAACGYTGTEMGDWGFLPTDPGQLKDALRRYNLAMVGAFVPVALRYASQIEQGIAAGLRTAQLLSAAGFTEALIVLADDNGRDPQRTANAGRIIGQYLTPEEWQQMAQSAIHFARTIFDTTGIRTVFHHHCAGFVETPGEVEKMLAATYEADLGLCLDTGHYSFAGGYPEAACALFGERIRHVHYKDCSPRIAQRSRDERCNYFAAVRQGIFCELGAGMVDFEAVTATLRSCGYRGWIVVEQDVLPGLGTPRECAQRNRDFLYRLGL